MLIASPRHTREDLRVWAERERMDAQLARSGALDRLFAIAAQAVADFLVDGPAYASVSWGKDSTVLADIVLRVAPRTPLIWFAAESIENPDCTLVRDAFLRRWPAARYFEIGVPGDGDPDSWDVTSASARRIMGLRAEESSTRRMSIGARGLATSRSCRPIGYWQAEHVFAYLFARDLPVHPAYACSLGGTLERRHLRVGPLGGERGTGHGRAEWERRYYGVLPSTRA